MKKVIYGCLFFILIGITVTITSCQREETSINDSSVYKMEPTYSIDEVKSIISDFNSETKAAPQWWIKVKAWIQSHIGKTKDNFNENCNGSYHCGPCPGFCIKPEKGIGREETDNDFATQEQRNNGLGVFGLYAIENRSTNEQIIMFAFTEDAVNDFTEDGFLYIDDDVPLLNENIYDTFSAVSIKFVKGKYHVVYDESTDYYYSLVKTIIE